MTQEDKQLLLQDLCARLPYGIKVKIGYKSPIVQIVETIGKNISGRDSVNGWDFDKVEIKPYLRPMSSMTEKEVKDLLKVHIKTKYGEDSDYYKNLIRIERISKHYDNSWSAWIVFKSSYTEYKSTTCFDIGRVTWETTINEIDWLNTHHFDYRGLIGKGLALEALKGMYNIKTE